MSSTESSARRPMQWRQPKATSRSYVLTDGSMEVARLIFASPLGSLARGEYQGQVITLKRGGFLCPYISFRKEGASTNLGILRFSWGFELAGQLTMSDGSNYTFHGPSIRKDYFELASASGKILCKLTHESGLLRRSGEFQDLAIGKSDPEPLLLAILLWYATMMMFDEELAASSAAAPGECPIQGVDNEGQR